MFAERASAYQTPEALLSRPSCQHIITMTTDQQVHLERLSESFRVTYPDGLHLIKSGNPEWQMMRRHRYLKPRSKIIARIEQRFSLHAEVFPDLQEFYQQHRSFWRNISPQDAIWQDIADYPELPYSAIYCPLRDRIEFSGKPGTPSGPYIAYGPAEVEPQQHPLNAILHPTGNWLVLEYPAVTSRVAYGILYGTRSNIVKLYRSIGRFLRRFHQPHALVEEPACLVIYGHPPADWRSGPQHIIPLADAWYPPDEAIDGCDTVKLKGG